ncbi:MAG: cytochrome b/b6 domain-containing protein [Acidobacteriota bacterium]
MQFFRYAQDYYGDWLPVQLLPSAGWLMLWLVVLFVGIHRLRRAVGEPLASEAESLGLSGEKYELGARLYHWGNFVFLMMLAVSGLALFVPRSIRGTIFSWVLIHEIFAGLYIVGLLVHIISALTKGEPRTMWFEKRDWADLKTIMGNFFGRTKNYPRFGKYDPLQKIYHALLTVVSMVLIFTGIYLVFSVEVWATFSHGWLRWQRLLHDLSAFIIVAIILGHIYFALIRVNWANLAAIINGKVSAKYFRLRHSAARWRPRVAKSK